MSHLSLSPMGKFSDYSIVESCAYKKEVKTFSMLWLTVKISLQALVHKGGGRRGL